MALPLTTETPVPLAVMVLPETRTTPGIACSHDPFTHVVGNDATLDQRLAGAAVLTTAMPRVLPETTESAMTVRATLAEGAIEMPRSALPSIRDWLIKMLARTTTSPWEFVAAMAAPKVRQGLAMVHELAARPSMETALRMFCADATDP